MKIILASKSGVRKEILQRNNIIFSVEPSSVDEDEAKKSLMNEGANPREISKNLAELKSIKVSNKFPNTLVLGADSVISLENKLINKPRSREEAMDILMQLNNRIHYLISSVCISKNGSMIWNYTDKATLKMKNFTDEELNVYLSKISNENLYAYNVYQIEGEGRNLFSDIDGDEDTIMGLPIKRLKEYLNNYK